jgi:hypothetical protein
MRLAKLTMALISLTRRYSSRISRVTVLRPTRTVCDICGSKVRVSDRSSLSTFPIYQKPVSVTHYPSMSCPDFCTGQINDGEEICFGGGARQEGTALGEPCKYGKLKAVVQRKDMYLSEAGSRIQDSELACSR